MRKAALLGAIPPFLLKTDDNPEGVDGQVFEDIKAAIATDRYAYFKGFLDNFYNVDVLGGDRISEQAWQASFNVAAGASPYATLRVRGHLADRLPRRPAEDRRADAGRPRRRTTGSCRSTPPADRLPGLIEDLELVTVEGGPHNIAWTHPEEVNTALLGFLAVAPRGHCTTFRPRPRRRHQ